MKRPSQTSRLFFLAGIFFLISASSNGQNQTFTSSGTFTVPAGVYSITVECWGAGGAGGGTNANNARGGGGGAGGAYAMKTLSVVPGTSYTVTVGGTTLGATRDGSAGNPSWFGTTGTVYAQGGAGGAAPNGGTAAGGTGSASSSIGDVVYPGGNGADGTTTLSGGGGGGAGSSGAGGNASGITGGTGTATGGGNGGNGSTAGRNGNTGLVYGGGGSGAYVNNNTNRSGGNGAAGRVVITWSGAFYSTGTFTVPAGVTSITVECWGGGGSGGGTTANSAGGGAGGAYAKKTLSVTPGATYTVTVGGVRTGTTGAGATGNPTWFGSAATVYAQGGAGGAAPNYGTVAGGIGSASSSIGDVVYPGGNGANGTTVLSGGGGGGAGSTGAGGNATGTAAGTGTTDGGGSGGNGLTTGGNGLTGSAAGGGGGGAYVNNNTNRTGGNGAAGKVVITWPQTVFYSQNSGDPNTLSNWKTSAGYSPAGFTDDLQTFVIQNGHTMTTSGSGWTIAGYNTILEIQGGGILTETTDISLSSATTLLIQDNGTLDHNVNSSAIFNGQESFANASTVNYGYNGDQTVADASYGNLTLCGSGIKTISASDVSGILSMEGTASASAAPVYNVSATLRYKGSAAQTTGPELPATFSSDGGVIIDNPSGVNLTGSLTIESPLTLSNGTFSFGANTVTFQTSDIPIIRTSGTITTSGDSNLSFGSPGNTEGNSFIIPAGTFTLDPVIGNLSVYRSNEITLNEQMMSIKGILLCNGPLNTNGKLTLLSTASGTALIDGTGTGTVTGNVTMQRYLPSQFGYKYFSSPFTSATVNEFASEINLSSSFPRIYKYDENRTSSGWVKYTEADSILHPLHGYALNFGNLVSSKTVEVTGEVNTGTVSRTIYNHNYSYTLGFNLVGNPYPSPIDWDATSGWNNTNIDDALYYFQAGGADEYSGTYSTYINGISNDGILNKNIIPSMQGFFVHVTNGSLTVTGILEMDDRVRITDQTHQFFKSDFSSNRSLIRISAGFSDGSGSADPTVIYFDEKGGDEFDGRVDALKLMNTDPLTPNLYSISDDGFKLSINALPAAFDSIQSIPLGLRIDRNGNIIFRSIALENLPDITNVYLHDRESGVYQKVNSEMTYNVPLQKGSYNTRFSLELVKGTTDLSNGTAETDILNIYSVNGRLIANIDLPEGSNKGTLIIYSISGQILFRQDIYSTGYNELNPGLKSGIYIVSFTVGNVRNVKKIFILNK